MAIHCQLCEVAGLGLPMFATQVLSEERRVSRGAAWIVARASREEGYIFCFNKNGA